jgi:membrane-associated phospholipid phosphatase
MRRLISVLALTLVFSAHAEEDDNLTRFGDIMQIALPALGLGATYIYDDREGRKQWLYTGATAIGTTSVMKLIYAKMRPNFSESRTSFPSGHTTGAFFGAAFLDQRYGKWWGIPSYTAAAITAYSRIESDNHFVDDTLMGASVGLMSSWLWTTPYEGNVALIPAYVEDGFGVQLNVSEGGKRDKFRGLDEQANWRYSIAFGPAWQAENKITAPASTGTTVDLDTFDKVNDPTSTANAMIEWFSGAHRVLFSFEPYEARDTGQVSQPTSFQGTTFLPTEQLATSYRLTDVRLQYSYDFAPQHPLILEAGAGLLYQRIQFALSTQDLAKAAEVKSTEWLPVVNGMIGYQINPRVSVAAELSGLSLSDQEQVDANVHLAYRFNRHWDAGIGYAIYDTKRDTAELKNDVSYDVLMTFVGYSFY